MKNVSFYNGVTVKGYVVSFKIKETKKSKIANIGIRDSKTKNITYVSMFENKNLKYNGQEMNLAGLQKVFMDSDGKPRNILVQAKGRISETKGINSKTGQPQVYVNTLIYSIEPFYEEDKQGAILQATGIVDAIKYTEEDDGTPVVKVKLGILRKNKDGDFNGYDQVTLNGYGDVADKFEDKDVERNCAIQIAAKMINGLPETDEYGDIIASGRKEIEIGKLKTVIEADEIEELLSVYKKAKNIETGEVVKAPKYDEEEDKPIKKSKQVEDEISDDDLDW